MPRPYPPEFRQRAVELARLHEKPFAKIADDLGIAEHRDGRQRIVKHRGSAHTDVDLGVLIDQAARWLVGPGQAALPLDAPKVSVATPLLAGQTGPELFSEPSVAAGTAGPAGALSASSSVLVDAPARVHGDLGFGVVEDGVFRDLVIARILRGRARRRPAQGRLLQQAQGRSSDPGRPPRRPPGVPARDQLHRG